MSKVSSEKKFDRPTRLLQDWLVLFNVHMYDEFHVSQMCFCVAVHVKGTDSNKSNLVNYR